MRAVANAREVKNAQRRGDPLPPPLPPTVNLDYIQCRTCGRRLNEQAAFRHIPFCQAQVSRGQGVPPRAPASIQPPPSGQLRVSVQPKGELVSPTRGAQGTSGQIGGPISGFSGTTVTKKAAAPAPTVVTKK